MKHFYLLILSAVLVSTMPAWAFAHAEGVSEAQEGAAINQALQSGAKKCADITDSEFELMGEFFMERMAGESHDSMNTMMKQTMGDSGEEQMHAVMGKRMSGCDANAEMPAGMMSNMMGGGMMGVSGMGNGGGMSATDQRAAFGAGMRGLYPTGFVTLWYAVGVLASIALVLVIAKYLKGLLK
ncbi:MAG: hypothetical protein Q7S48_05230 [bacterium]|nr:hypothetical protein [bacterium]